MKVSRRGEGVKSRLVVTVAGRTGREVNTAELKDVLRQWSGPIGSRVGRVCGREGRYGA